MYQKIKLIVVSFIFAFFSHSVFAGKQLNSYEEVAHSLNEGNVVLLNFQQGKCKVTPTPSKEELNDRLAIKLNDLVEWHSSFNGNGSKTMKVLGSQEGGLFGNKKFEYYRNITLVFEDGTVMVLSDHVNPVTFDLKTRTQVLCKLTGDGSGGVIATELTKS